MADYFLSDIHLCLDWPDRDRRLIQFLEQLDSSDRVFIVGDLCDFWFAAQERNRPDAITPGLAKLREFVEQGGTLVLLLGNHDAWLGDFYQKQVGLPIRGEPLEVDSFGLKIRLEHGHRNKAKPVWKAWLEGHTFFRIYSALPTPIARLAQRTLEKVNARGRKKADREMIAAYEAFSDRLQPAPDIATFGHVHEVHVAHLNATRVVVLGDWFERSNYLRVDSQGAKHLSLPDVMAVPGTPVVPPIAAQNSLSLS